MLVATPCCCVFNIRLPVLRLQSWNARVLPKGLTPRFPRRSPTTSFSSSGFRACQLTTVARAQWCAASRCSFVAPRSSPLLSTPSLSHALFHSASIASFSWAVGSRRIMGADKGLLLDLYARLVPLGLPPTPMLRLTPRRSSSGGVRLPVVSRICVRALAERRPRDRPPLAS